MYKILIQIAEGHGIILIFRTNHYNTCCNFNFHSQFYCPAFICNGRATSLSRNLTILSLLPSLPSSFRVPSSICLCIFFSVNTQVLGYICVLVSVLLPHLIASLLVFYFGSTDLSPASSPDSSRQPFHHHIF